MNTLSRIPAILMSLLCFFGILRAQPVAQFSSDVISGCAPLVVQFTDLSSGNPNSWEWDFGNNNTSTLQNPGAFYLNAGTYTVTLTAKNASGSHTLTKTALIEVFPTPIAQFFSADTFSCNPATVQFTDQSVASGAPINSWFWNFGDGQSSNLPNPSHDFPSGNYTIFLTVKDTNGCSDYQLIEQYIHVQHVQASFTNPQTLCPVPKLFTFNNTSTGKELQYQWDFGNGDVSTLKNPQVNFSSLGSKNISLTVTDDIGCTSTVSHSINAIDLQANFGFNVLCNSSSITLNLKDSTSPNPSSWLWKFGDGTSSTIQNPMHTLTSDQAFSITLISKVGNSCADTITKIYTPPKALFQSDSFSCKSPFPIAFTNQSTGEGLSYSWKFGNSDSSNLQHPNFLYQSDKVRDSMLVELRITDRFGCVKNFKNYIEISKPYVLINADKNTGCVPRNVDFSNSIQSIDSVVSWYWDLGNGVTTTDLNPSTTYSAVGSYDVKFVVTTASGCIDSVYKEKFILSGKKPDYIDFTSYDTVCWHNVYDFHGTAGYFDTSLHINSISWLFGANPYCIQNNLPCKNSGEPFYDTLDVEFDTGHWIDHGSDTILFAAGFNGCNDTIYKFPITVRPFSNICYPIQGDTNGLITPFMDNRPPFSMYPLMEHLADDVRSLSVGSCTAPYTFHVRNCSIDYDTVHLFYLHDFQTGQITEIDKNPTVFTEITLSKPGLYQILIETYNDTTKAGGCTDINGNFAFAVDSIVSGFTSSIKQACFHDTAGVAVSFTDTSFALLGSISKWLWDFGDGMTLENTAATSLINYSDTLFTPLIGSDPIFVSDNHGGLTSGTYQHPIHVYKDTGTYIVKHGLLVENRLSKCCGSAKPDHKRCFFMDLDTIRITKIYTGFKSTDTSFCPGTVITFTDTSVTNSVNALSWTWDFGDGSTPVSTQNPTHQYDQPGEYDVSLIVKDANGCTDSLLMPAYISITKPIPSFSVSSPGGCTNQAVVFSNSSVGVGMSYLWDFGDGTSDTTANPSHLFLLPGNYTIQLRVTDANGCDSSLVQNDLITIFDKPTAALTANSLWSACPPMPVVFSDLSQSGIKSWYWDFGDGQSSTLQNPNHVYTVSGDYDLRLIVTNTHGCKDTVTLDGYIEIGGPSGTFSFDPGYGCLPLEVSFKATAQNTSTFSWDFGDGTIINSDSDSLVHVYLTTGVFNPKLFLIDSLGCTFIVPNTKQVIPDILHAEFQLPDTVLCDFGSVVFTNTSTTFYPTSFQWSFGDGDSSTLVNPVHLYDSLGTFLISLFAQDSIGCSSTYSKEISVYRPPVVAATISDSLGCAPLSILFNTGIDPQIGVSSWHWDFGDGASGSGNQVEHTFYQGGLYDVLLEFRYADGLCIGDTLLHIQANLPLADFIHVPSMEADQFMPIYFYNQSQHASSWHWDFGNGDTSTLENPVYAYQHAGIYSIQLIVFDSLGCSDTIVKTIIINPIIPNVFTPDGDGVNDFFIIDGIESHHCDLKIVNRWGNLIFESPDYQNDWNGRTQQGALVNDGVYFYLINCEYIQQSQGYVQIISGSR